MQDGTLLLPHDVYDAMTPACVACTHPFVEGERMWLIDLGSPATFLGIVYAAGTRIAMCKPCRQETMVYRRERAE